MKKLYSILLFLGFILCLSINVYGQDTEKPEGQTEIPSELRQLYAQSAVLMDADSGRVLFEKNGYEQKPMASTTKIMTLIVTLENANLDEIVTVSQYAAGMPDVQLGIRKDEQYRLGDLLYSLMLESHNDSAVAIAEHVGGSVEGFAEMMNAKARAPPAFCSRLRLVISCCTVSNSSCVTIPSCVSGITSHSSGSLEGRFLLFMLAAIRL